MAKEDLDVLLEKELHRKLPQGVQGVRTTNKLFDRL
jgi:hypothetical protein